MLESGVPHCLRWGNAETGTSFDRYTPPPPLAAAMTDASPRWPARVGFSLPHPFWWALVGFLAMGWVAAPAQVPGLAPESYPVERLRLVYGNPHPALPPIESLAALEVELSERNGVIVAPAVGETGVPRRIDASFGGRPVAPSALLAVFRRIVAELNDRQIDGVFVVPSRDEIDPQTREDFRPSDQRDLTLVVWASEVAVLRTVAKGSRFAVDRSIDNRKHRHVRRHSPLLPRTADRPGDLLRARPLDDYLQRLNRHPGRRVEAAISSTADPGQIALDYLINEKRSWMAYAQLSNTGTEATAKFRQRVGFLHHQLTNFDDALALDFVTTSFSAGSAAFLSYDRPLRFPDRLRVKLLGSHGDFTAKDVGIALEEFTGSTTSGAIEVTWSPWRWRGFALDWNAGFAWQNVEVENRTIGLRGNSDLMTPYTYLRFERATETMSTYLRLGAETNLASLAGTTPESVFALGRLESDIDWWVLKFEFGHSMYLEPLLYRRDFTEGRDWRRARRAHEVAVVVRGQQVLDDKRLIPQKQFAIGGLFSVRGYPESVSGGDDVAFFSGEYRLHLPRLLRPYSEIGDNGEGPGPRAAPAPASYFGRPFHWRPAQVYGLPDWNLLVRAFFDAGYTRIVRPRPEETNRNLVGTGLGLELQAMGKLSVRADWGVALEALETGNAKVRPGDSRLHFLASFVW
jgi:hypothetical protein